MHICKPWCPLIEQAMCAFSALLPELGFPLDGGRDAAGCHRADDLSVVWTVPKAPHGSNSKGGLIDNRIGIVRTRSACRMNIRGEGAFPEMTNSGTRSHRNEQLGARHGRISARDQHHCRNQKRRRATWNAVPGAVHGDGG